MSSAQIKNNLKAARESIANKNYAKALDLARKVLTFDPQNYNALVFAGVSLLNLSQFAESEASYRDAISASEMNPLAWQGLINLFEKQAKIDGLKEASIALANIYSVAYPTSSCLI
jgi:superkiller protein 3